MNSQGKPWLPPSRNSASLVCRLRQLWQLLPTNGAVSRRWQPCFLEERDIETPSASLSRGRELLPVPWNDGGIHDHGVCRPLSICHCCIRGSPLRTGVQKCPYTFNGCRLRFPRTGKAAARHLTCPILLSPDTICRGTPIHIVRFTSAHHRPVQTELAPQSVPAIDGGHCQLFNNAVNWVGSRTSSFSSCLTPAGCIMTWLSYFYPPLITPCS